jgi:hypothetical protein
MRLVATGGGNGIAVVPGAVIVGAALLWSSQL